jgi:hypothetical protein
MSKMHGDESGDLRVVAKILRDVFGVRLKITDRQALLDCTSNLCTADSDV